LKKVEGGVVVVIMAALGLLI